MYGVLAIRLIVGSSRWPSRPKPWVSRITGTNSQFGLAREFIRPVYDYTYASKGTGKNTHAYFALPPGIYEVYYPTSWKHEYRGYIEVDEQGDLHDITREDVDTCLKNTISE